MYLRFCCLIYGPLDLYIHKNDSLFEPDRQIWISRSYTGAELSPELHVPVVCRRPFFGSVEYMAPCFTESWCTDFSCKPFAMNDDAAQQKSTAASSSPYFS